MTREEARTQFEDVLGVIREQLDIVEAICNDQLSCPIKIKIAAPTETGAQEGVAHLVGKAIAHNVALSVLDSMDPKVYRDMVNKYPDIDPDYFIEAAPANADELLKRHAVEYENSEEILEAAAENLAGAVYSIVREEASTPEENLKVHGETWTAAVTLSIHLKAED